MDLTDRAYHLRFGPAATAHVKSTLDRAVRPHLHDVRAMLRLPLPEVGITAGCNFAAVHVLLNVLSGLSRLMGSGPRNSGDAFKEFVTRRYPWSLEPRTSNYRRKRGTAVLYDSFRNGFSHDLGLVLESGPLDAKGRRRDRLRIEGKNLGVVKQPSLPAELLQALDNVDARPSWVGATIVSAGRASVLVDAVALYWGVRRLIFDHTSRSKDVISLHRMIDEAWARRKAAGRVDTIEVRESGVVLFNQKRVRASDLTRRLKPRARRPPV
jgi:hypothetical protein